jgi:lysophospholipase L1-like esterase
VRSDVDALIGLHLQVSQAAGLTLLVDNVHLNDTGAAIVAKLVEDFLQTHVQTIV